jgi:REP element-mobilizing transposase RayT
MFYDPEKNIDHHRRNLPHWQQSDAISFVTFRLADSIPTKALNDWDNERRIWLFHRLPSAAGDLSDLLSQLTEPDRRDYLRRFGKQFHDLLDSGHGACLLRNPAHSAIVESALLHFDDTRYQLGGYVVMPNHVHVLLAPAPDHTIGSITGSWKRFASREINKLTGSEGSLWQHESFDHLVRDAGSLEGFRRYIRQNPEKARLHTGEYCLGSGTLK